MVIDPDGTICTFCAGSMWLKKESDSHFKKTGTMPNFGRGIGKWVMTHGLMAAGNGVFYFGEYFNNPDRKGVTIYEYTEKMQQWSKVHVFPQGKFVIFMHFSLIIPESCGFALAMRIMNL